MRPVTNILISRVLTKQQFDQSLWIYRNGSPRLVQGFELEDLNQFIRIFHNLGSKSTFSNVWTKRQDWLVAYGEALHRKGFSLRPHKTKGYLDWIDVLGFEPKTVLTSADLSYGDTVEIAGATWSGYRPTFLRYEPMTDSAIVALGTKEYRVKFENVLYVLP